MSETITRERKPGMRSASAALTETDESEKTGIDDGPLDPDGTYTPEGLKEDTGEYYLNPILTRKPATEAQFKVTITFTRFKIVHEELMKHQRDYKTKFNHYMSMPQLIDHVAKHYIGRKLTADQIDAIWQKHMEWQRIHHEKTGMAECPGEDMNRKLLELFNVGVGPKLD